MSNISMIPLLDSSSEPIVSTAPLETIHVGFIQPQQVARLKYAEETIMTMGVELWENLVAVTTLVAATFATHKAPAREAA